MPVVGKLNFKRGNVENELVTDGLPEIRNECRIECKRIAESELHIHTAVVTGGTRCGRPLSISLKIDVRRRVGKKEKPDGRLDLADTLHPAHLGEEAGLHRIDPAPVGVLPDPAYLAEKVDVPVLDFRLRKPQGSEGNAVLRRPAVRQ